MRCDAELCCHYMLLCSRLSSQPSVMSGVMSGSGLERLVELSVCKKARLDSDSTLVAVITAVSAKLFIIIRAQHVFHLSGQKDFPVRKHIPSAN